MIHQMKRNSGHHLAPQGKCATIESLLKELGAFRHWKPSTSVPVCSDMSAMK